MPFSLYLHFPFCRNKCSYCDFYKEVYDNSRERNFFGALKKETKLLAEKYGKDDNQIRTLYIGGGTPSLVTIDLFIDWLNDLKSFFFIPPGIEFSFENNPESVTLELLTRIKEIGVNRPTFGIQSFQKKLLKKIDRRHNPDDSYRAAYLAHALGFDSFGVDLLFGLPGQGSKELSRDLDELLTLDPPHISFYQLTVEDNTRFANLVNSGKLKLPDDNLSSSLYKGGVEFFEAHNLNRYEICSFAKEGHECKHNIVYWQGDDYLALGPGGHSYMRGERFANVSDLNQYISKLRDNELPQIPDNSGSDQRKIEAIMLGLRLTQGINRERYEFKYDCSLDSVINQKQFELLTNSGHIQVENSWVRLSSEGLMVADEIISRLVSV